MSSFCTAKATRIFSAKNFSIHCICVSLDVNFNESLTNDVVSFEQLGPVLPYLTHHSLTFELLIIFLLIIEQTFCIKYLSV